MRPKRSLVESPCYLDRISYCLISIKFYTMDATVIGASHPRTIFLGIRFCIFLLQEDSILTLCFTICIASTRSAFEGELKIGDDLFGGAKSHEQQVRNKYD